MAHWQEVSFPNGRGRKLTGLLGEPGRIPGQPPETGQNDRVVVLCHGFTGSRLGGGACELGDRLAGRGWAALAFDFAGCGDSEGDFADLTLGGQVADLTAAVDWCFERGFARVVTLGRSFGGTTAVCQAAMDRRVSAVATFAAPARTMDLFQGFAGRSPGTAGDPEEPVSLGETTVKRKFFVDLARWDVGACAAVLSPRAFLIMHGTADEVVPPADAELLYEAAGEPKKMVLVPGADHRFEGGSDQAWAVFLDWLDIQALLHKERRD